MNIHNVLNILGDLILLGYGLVSLVRPAFIAGVLSIDLPDKRGIAEFRILSGGFIVGLALGTLALNQPLGYHILGLGWLGAGITRITAYLVDRPPLNTSYVASLISEIALGIMMLV